jgi:hypothetical protein
VYPPGVGRKKSSMPEPLKGQEEKGTMPKVEAEPKSEEPKT